MPRIGAEPERRKALIHAAIEMIGEQGSLDVSVKDIAKQAGMSSALAFHYFGDKDEIIIQTMRHLLREFSASVVRELQLADKPQERIDALIRASFTADQFERKTVAAWLVFYLKAYSSPQAARLLGIYTSRLKSNLVDAFKAFLPDEEAVQAADGLGALIDGLYIRQALAGSDSPGAISLSRAFVRATCKISYPNNGVH
jgi:TetR/AcrR family transcriptional regulator, transcriptional repressor of bet genes